EMCLTLVADRRPHSRHTCSAAPARKPGRWSIRKPRRICSQRVPSLFWAIFQGKKENAGLLPKNDKRALCDSRQRHGQNSAKRHAKCNIAGILRPSLAPFDKLRVAWYRSE